MKIAVVFGGQSFEHEISIVSAIAMKEVIKEELVYIFLDQNREFYQIPTDTIRSKLFSSGEYKSENRLVLKNGGFFKSGFLGDKRIDIDTVLNLTHGGDGEDGTLSSLFEFFDIPYIGPRTEASVISFNKFLTKAYAKEIGVKTLDYESADSLSGNNDFPLIVKPSRLGSSIGVSVVKNEGELEYALDVAKEFDRDILIEPFIKDIKEFNLAGCKIGDDFIFSIIEEPAKNEFLDFDKKYLDFNRTKRVKEADISDEMKQKLKENFKKIYNRLFEGSLIRCDFFMIDDEVYLNEINPIPGSMANYLFDDFNTVVVKLTNSLPKRKKIDINYEYVNKIQAAKCKA